MTYTHLTINELVMIEAYYQEGKKVCAIAKSLGRARQTIYNFISFLKTGLSAYDYYQRYKANKRHCGRQKTPLTKPIQEFIQSYLASDWSLDVIKGTYPDKILCSMRTLYRLAHRDIFNKEDMCLGKANERQMGRKRGEENKLFAEICGNALTFIQTLKLNLVTLKEILLLERIIKALLSR